MVYVGDDASLPVENPRQRMKLYQMTQTPPCHAKTENWTSGSSDSQNMSKPTRPLTAKFEEALMMSRIVDINIVSAMIAKLRRRGTSKVEETTFLWRW